MASKTNAYHHIELHTIDPTHVLKLFMCTYNFELIAERVTRKYRQWLLQSSSCDLLISSIVDSVLEDTVNIQDFHYDVLTSILSNSNTRDCVVNRDTVFNVALHVKCVRTIIDCNPNIQVKLLIGLRNTLIVADREVRASP